MQETGIVHVGIGAFHRAHEAWYTDRAMSAGNRDWMIEGVSLRSPTVATQLNPQDGLYTVTERSAHAEDVSLVGAVRRVLVAPEHPQAIIDRIAAPGTRIVSFTVTEKGYCRTTEGRLDPAQAGSGSFYPFLAEAMRERQAQDRGGLTLLSCDNLPGNGALLKQLVTEYLAANAPDVAGWFESHCSCPSTMVDRIVPASTQDDRRSVERQLGLADEGAVFTEPFSQWVIEDHFASGRPDWEDVGAQLVGDVAPFETAKLRMLNGAHSALAYIGLSHGHEFVHQAIGDPLIRPLVDRLMRHEAAPTIEVAPGQDLAGYAASLVTRFENPALQHRLSQIAIDGSQKVPQRWLATLAANARKGRTCPAILSAIAAWLIHLRGDNGVVDDPMAGPLRAIWESAGASGIVDAMFGPSGPLASDWHPASADRDAIGNAMEKTCRQ